MAEAMLQPRVYGGRPELLPWCCMARWLDPTPNPIPNPHPNPNQVGEVNPDFKVVTFANTSCDQVYIRPIGDYG